MKLFKVFTAIVMIDKEYLVEKPEVFQYLILGWMVDLISLENMGLDSFLGFTGISLTQCPEFLIQEIQTECLEIW